MNRASVIIILSLWVGSMALAGVINPGGGSSTGGGYSTIQDEGTPLTQRTTVNFAGGGIICGDVSSVTTCTVASGSGAPGGSTTNVQFNSAGTFSGISGAIVNGNFLQIPAIGDSPIPTTGVTIMAEDRGSHSFLATMGTSSVDSYMQSAIWNSTIQWCAPTVASTATTVLGCYGMSEQTAVGTITNPALASTNFSTSLLRQVVTTAGTASLPTEHKGQTAYLWRGNNAGLGGFRFVWRGSFPAQATNDRAFIGLSAITTAFTGTYIPSTVLNTLYWGWDAGQTTLRACGNDASGSAGCSDCSTFSSLYQTQSTTAVYELAISARSNDSSVSFYGKRLDMSGVPACTFTITNSANTPSNTTFLTWRTWKASGNVAAAVAHSVNKIYIETDN